MSVRARGAPRGDLAASIVLITLAAELLAWPASALAAWPGDPLVNVPVSLAAGEKNDVFVVSDGCGGVIVAWEDERDGDADIYAQRIDVNGETRWATDGVPVCTAIGDQGLYHSSTGTTGFTPLLADGDGGVWIVWQDERSFASRARDVYIQRLDADGRAAFGADGQAVAARTGMEDQPTLCSDGDGGVFVVWQDKTADPIFYDLHGQRVDSRGELAWNGGLPKPLVVVGWDQDGPSACPDGEGGFFLAWSDSRDDVGDIYAQRFDADGDPRWIETHRAVATGAGGQDAVVAIRAEDGGLLLAWVDRRAGSPDIYAQKLTPATGNAQWTPGGRAVCTAAESQYRPALATDAGAGAIVAWYDFRDASGPPWDLNIYAQRILAGGGAAWTADGVAVCVAPNAQRDVDVSADGAGGVYLAWEDDRGGDGREDIYAQRIDGDGQVSWDADGVAVCTASGNQQRPDLVAGAGGLVAAWKDDRDVLYEPDVYADRVLATGHGVIGVNRVLIDFTDPQSTLVDTFQVSNVGVAALTVTEIDLAPESSFLFDVTSARAPPFVLSPGERVDVFVYQSVPAPTRDPIAGTVRIHHDVPDQVSPVAVRLLGDLAVGPVGDTPPVATPVLRIHPNPFNPRLGIVCELPAAAAVTLRVHDLAGRRVRTLLAAEARDAGRHELHWDGRDDAGRACSGGIYLLRMDAAATRTTVRATLVR
jgi:hypothetical protein